MTADARGRAVLGSAGALRYSAAVRIAYHMMNSPVGLLFLARTPAGLRYCQYMDRKSLKRMIASHEAELPDATWEPSLLELKRVTEQLESYFNGGLVEFDLPLDSHGSEFQLKVWSALRRIPFGETRSYGQVAAAVGQPRASRAVGGLPPPHRCVPAAARKFAPHLSAVPRSAVGRSASLR